MRAVFILSGLCGLAAVSSAATVSHHHRSSDPVTWPSPQDDLEEIMFQQEFFGTRDFGDPVRPCSSQPAGPGREAAAEWIRAAFHDVATRNAFLGLGGLDGSLQYELSSGENPGAGFETTLGFFSSFTGPHTSLADVIAAGVYAAVRACGGPVVPVRSGRTDARFGGPIGVPAPQNSAFTLVQQFARMGFTATEMIQLTACGHTLGGVHASEFPDIVPPGSAPADGRVTFDTSPTVFDNRIVTTYLDGSTVDPLIVGPSVRATRNSDFKVFNVDGNATVRTLADPANFQSTCGTVLQRLIDAVPASVVLSPVPITPYALKPVNLQLSIEGGGQSILFTGSIRVRTTTLPLASIASLTVHYRNREGRSTCPSGPCSFDITVTGVGKGFDDSFAFFGIQHQLPVSSGISAFTVTVNLRNGASVLFDNNKKLYPLQDAVMLQPLQSCLLQSNGQLTLTAAVRHDRVNQPTTAVIWFKMPQAISPIPGPSSMTVRLFPIQKLGEYTLFATEALIPGGLSVESFAAVTNGFSSEAISDNFRRLDQLAGTCFPL